MKRARALGRRYGRARVPFAQRGEQELIALGRCSWETSNTERCGHKAKPGHHFCSGHERDWRDLYPHLRLPMRKAS